MFVSGFLDSPFLLWVFLFLSFFPFPPGLWCFFFSLPSYFRLYPLNTEFGLPVFLIVVVFSSHVIFSSFLFCVKAFANNSDRVLRFASYRRGRVPVALRLVTLSVTNPTAFLGQVAPSHVSPCRQPVFRRAGASVTRSVYVTSRRPCR